MVVHNLAELTRTARLPPSPNRKFHRIRHPLPKRKPFLRPSCLSSVSCLRYPHQKVIHILQSAITHRDSIRMASYISHRMSVPARPRMCIQNFKPFAFNETESALVSREQDIISQRWVEAPGLERRQGQWTRATATSALQFQVRIPKTSKGFPSSVAAPDNVQRPDTV